MRFFELAKKSLLLISLPLWYGVNKTIKAIRKLFFGFSNPHSGYNHPLKILRNTLLPVFTICAAASGALKGAAIGAMIGSIIPGVGTLAGAIVGGIMGGLINASMFAFIVKHVFRIITYFTVSNGFERNKDPEADELEKVVAQGRKSVTNPYKSQLSGMEDNPSGLGPQALNAAQSFGSKWTFGLIPDVDPKTKAQDLLVKIYSKKYTLKEKMGGKFNLAFGGNFLFFDAAAQKANRKLNKATELLHRDPVGNFEKAEKIYNAVKIAV